MNDFYKEVRKDILDFLKNLGSRVFFNEKDFQVHLVKYLSSNKYYDDVEMEYFVPKAMLYERLASDDKKSPWKGSFYIDIVVCKGDEYIPIELKYKTKQEKVQIERFGGLSSKPISIIKTHSAQDLGRYAFWKDVKRVELLQNAFFGTVKHGLCIFLTNDLSYKNSCTDTICENFAMSEGKHGTDMSWKGGSDSTTANKPDFSLVRQYEIDWDGFKSIISGKEIEFIYTIVTVKVD